MYNAIVIALAIAGLILIVVVSAMLVLVLWLTRPIREADETQPLFFETDPLDDDMVLPAAWPAHNVTDMNGRPFFVGRPS